MQDEPLTPEERDAFARLPREMPPPPGLEGRVVAALGAGGAFGRRRAAPWLRLAAALAIFAAGLAAGRLAPGAGPAEGPASAGAAAEGDLYLLLLYGGETGTPDEERARTAEYARWAGVQADAGRLVSAEKLADTAVVLGPAPGAPGAGPAGFFMIRAASPEDAAAIARDCPHLRHGGTVVVRPVEMLPG